MVKGALVIAAAALLATPVGGEPAKPRIQFPDIELRDLGGRPAPLSVLLGKATVLNFWATWCGPCRTELPELQKLYNEFGAQGLVVLAVNLDSPTLRDETLAQQLGVLRPRIEGFARNSNVSLPVYLLDGRDQAELGVDRIPATIVLDDKGRVVAYFQGYSSEGMRKLKERVAETLAARGGKEGS